jgi:hypothetical protein
MGEQMDLVEVMELNDEGLIQHHKVYWGWFGLWFCSGMNTIAQSLSAAFQRFRNEHRRLM